MSEKKKTLRVNCGLALLLKDRENWLDSFDHVNINSGRTIMSSQLNAKLSAMGAKINCGDLTIKDINAEILMLDGGAVIDGKTQLKDLFVIAKEDIVITAEGVARVGEAEGFISLGKIFYPEGADMSCIAKASGEKIAYPDGALVVLGNHDLENIMANSRGDKKFIWISGRIRALEKKTLEEARSAGMRFGCDSFFSFEGLNKEYGDMITCQSRVLIPDGYEITGNLNGNELALYGSRVYVDGKFSMEEKDIPLLEELEGIIVKGRASLPSSAAKIFRSKGKAGDYYIFEGRLVEINGFEQLSHSSLEAMIKKGEKLTITVNGCLLFDEGVTADDMEAIASLSYNGTVLVPGEAKAALAGKVKSGNGFMGDPETMKELTGQSLQEMISGAPSKEEDDSQDTSINMGTYILA